MTQLLSEGEAIEPSVRLIRTQFGATECAHLLRVDPATIHRWATGSPMSHAQKRQVSDLALIGEIFSGASRAATALPWLHAMNPALQYDTPAEQILRGSWINAIAAARDFVRVD